MKSPGLAVTQRLKVTLPAIKSFSNGQWQEQLTTDSTDHQWRLLLIYIDEHRKKLYQIVIGVDNEFNFNSVFPIV